MKEFVARMQNLVDHIRSAPRRPGVDTVFLPGEMEARADAESRRLGVPLEQYGMENLGGVAEDLGLRDQLDGLLKMPLW